MRTSSKARYALYLAIDIAKHQSQGPVSLREVAVREGLSTKFLEQIAGELSKSGYLRGVRGAQGGYLLADDATSITAGDIMRAAEGGFLPVYCLDTDITASDNCPNQGACGTAVFWHGLQQAVDSYIDGVTIADLVADTPCQTLKAV